MRGAYHFFTFRTPGREQALNFIAAVPRDENALPPVVDFEFAGNSKQRSPKAELLEGLKAFLDTVEDHYGQRPLLYVTKASFAEYLEGEDWANPIWLRDIFGEPGPVGGRPWVIWQYADNVRMPGIEGPVDQNALRGTLRDLLESTRVATGGHASLRPTRGLDCRRWTDTTTTPTSMFSVLEIHFRQPRHLHEVSEQAGLEWLVPVNGDRKANDGAFLAVDVVATLHP